LQRWQSGTHYLLASGCLTLAARLNLTLVRRFGASLTKLEPSAIAALPVHLFSSLNTGPWLPEGASTLTALTSLMFSGTVNADPTHMPVDLLRPLSRMRQLIMMNVNGGINVKEMLALPALQELQALELPRCKLQAAPRRCHSSPS
jgi:hypothetical protein